MAIMSQKDLPPERHFGPGDILIEQGEPAFEAYLMLDGSADVFVSDVKVGTIACGEIFGESALFKDADYGASVKAAGNVTVQPIPPDILDEKIKTLDPMIRALIRMMMARIRKSNDERVR